MLIKIPALKFFKNSLITIIGTLAGGFLGYLFHFVVSRKISVEQYGELQTLMSLASVIGIFGLAISFLIIKYSAILAKQNDRINNRLFYELIIKKIIKLSLILFIIFLAISPLITNQLGLSSWWGVFSVGLFGLVSLLAIVYNGFFTGWEKFTKVNLVNVSVALTKFILGLILTLYFFQATSAFLAILFSGLVNWLLFYSLFKTDHDFNLADRNQPATAEVRQLIKQAQAEIGSIFIFSLVVTLISNLDIILVKYYATAETTAYYGALSIISKIIYWVNGAVIAVVLPRVCSGGDKLKRSSQIFKLSYLAIIGISSVAIIGYSLLNKFIMNLSFGVKYVGLSDYLWLYSIVATVFSLLMLEANFAYAKANYFVSYVLSAVIVFMTIGLYFYHTDLEQIAWVMLAVFSFGYLATLIANLVIKQKPQLEEIEWPEGQI